VKTTEKVPLFKFPRNAELRESWKRAIPRKDWTVTDSHRVCAKHFNEIDFLRVSSDNKANRRTARKSLKLTCLRLKPTAVPSVFPNLPKYLSRKSSTPRSTTSSTASARRDVENIRIQEQNLDLLKEDTVESFESFKKD